jgi:hypothetical protein
MSVQPTASPAFTGAATFANTGDVVPLTVTNAGTANSFVVNDASGDTTPFVIDASGNVGIGVSSPTHKIDCGGEFRLRGTGPSSEAGKLHLYYVSDTNRATITTGSSGEIIVETGASSPATRLTISSTGTATFAGQVLVTAGSGSSGSYKPGLAISGDDDTGIHQVSGNANTLSIVTNGTERVRVKSDGEVLIGSTTDQGAFKLQVTDSAWIDNLYLSTTTNWGRLAINHNGATTFAAGWNNTDTGSTGQTTLNILRNGTSVGSITTTNAATAFNTSSDYRLKDDVQAMDGATARLASLRPVTWQWRVGGVGEGFLAHELANAVPLAVTGEKDAVGGDGKPIWQSVDLSKLVPLLVAALQESNARIAALEERLSHA